MTPGSDGFAPGGYQPGGFLPADAAAGTSPAAPLAPGPDGFDPGGFDPGGFLPPNAVAVPFAPNDLDIDLFAFLKATLAIPVSPAVIPPGPTQPATATYTLVVEVPVTRAGGMAGLAQRTYQVDLRSTNPNTPPQLAEVLRLAVQGFRGTFGTNQVRYATCRRLPNGYDQALNKGTAGTFRVAVELGFWFRQPFPTY